MTSGKLGRVGVIDISSLPPPTIWAIPVFLQWAKFP